MDSPSRGIGFVVAGRLRRGILGTDSVVVMEDCN